MDQKSSAIFTPYKALGLVCTDVPPVFESKAKEKRLGDVNAAIGNVFVTYRMQPFRRYKVSDPMPSPITAITRDKAFVFAAAGKKIGVYRHNQTLFQTLNVDNEVKFMLSFVEVLFVVDVKNNFTVFDVNNGTGLLTIPSAEELSYTAVAHPATYLNKVILGGSKGELLLFNIKTGQLIHNFRVLQNYDSAVTIIEQSTALDVVAIGHANGRVQLRNLKLDKLICSFKQDGAITAVTFRTDGVESMATADAGGNIAIWDLEGRILVGLRANAHSSAIHGLYFIRGMPFLISSGKDNRMVKWTVEDEQSIPVLHTELSGHSAPVSSLAFFDENAMVSASVDGFVRSYNIIRDDVMKSLGKAREVKKSEVSRDRFMDVPMEPIVAIDIGLARESAWDNAICLHKGSPVVSTWTTRRKTKGENLLYHKRFIKNPNYVAAYATCLQLSACGNFAFIGYSSGHIDMFNVQSGLFKLTFVFLDSMNEGMELEQNDDDLRAHSFPVKALVTDLCNQKLVSGDSSGIIRTWSINPAKCIGRAKVQGSVVKFKLDRMNSLLAVAADDGGLGIMDIVTGKFARKWPKAHPGATVTALDFSRDGKWIVSADDACSIKIWDIASNYLIDHMKFPLPCLALNFNPGGQFLATAHEGERAVYIWANMPMFINSANMNVRNEKSKAFHELQLPSVVNSNEVDEEDDDVDIRLAIESDEESVEEMDVEEQDIWAGTDGLFSFSGLPPSRWANLPDLEAIRARNKPIEPPKKPKAAPFFLPTTESLEGVQFELADPSVLAEKERSIVAKRKLLELETPFSKELKLAKTGQQYSAAFEKLKSMALTAVDFQIRSLSAASMVGFINMLIHVLESRQDLDVCQSYLNTFLRIHRESLWNYEDEESEALTSEMLAVKNQLNSANIQLKMTVNENLAVLQWIKSAVIQIC